MNVLVIDTATPIELVAVSVNGRTVDETAPVGVSHSVTIFDSIDRCLSSAGISLKDIGLIGVGTGPGSFTGIRIAVTTARMLAQLLEVPLVGADTHLVYGASVRCEPGDQVLVAFDARKKRVFGSLYRCAGGDLLPETVIASGDYDMEHIIDMMDREDTVRCVGDGTSKYRTVLEEGLARPVFEEGFLPSGERACRIVRDIFEARPGAGFSWNDVTPFYGRKSDAEIAKNGKEKT